MSVQQAQYGDKQIHRTRITLAHRARVARQARFDDFDHIIERISHRFLNQTSGGQAFVQKALAQSAWILSDGDCYMMDGKLGGRTAEVLQDYLDIIQGSEKTATKEHALRLIDGVYHSLESSYNASGIKRRKMDIATAFVVTKMAHDPEAQTECLAKGLSYASTYTPKGASGEILSQLIKATEGNVPAEVLVFDRAMRDLAFLYAKSPQHMHQLVIGVLHYAIRVVDYQSGIKGEDLLGADPMVGQAGPLAVMIAPYSRAFDKIGIAVKEPGTDEIGYIIRPATPMPDVVVGEAALPQDEETRAFATHAKILLGRPRMPPLSLALHRRVQAMRQNPPQPVRS